MGAVLDTLRHVANVLAAEANSVSDNPLIIAGEGIALSGGNFHAQAVAFAADMMALAICEIGSLAERRIAMLVDPALSRLPAFLTPRPGLNSNSNPGERQGQRQGGPRGRQRRGLDLGQRALRRVCTSDGKFVNKDQNNYAEVYVKDLQTGKVTLASLDTKNHQVNANAIEPALSADGRHVAFLGPSTPTT